MVDGTHKLDHLYLHGFVERSNYSPPSGGGSKKLRQVNRLAHGRLMLAQAERSFTSSDQQRDALSSLGPELQAIGSVIVLEGATSREPLKLDSLNQSTNHKDPRPKWILLSVRPASEDQPERATVWVSDDYRTKFLKMFQDYLNEETPAGSPRQNELVANIAQIKKAKLTDLWTSGEPPSSHGTHWWEVWLESRTGNSALSDLDTFLEQYHLRRLSPRLRFQDRLIVWIEASRSTLEILPFTSVPVREIRAPRFLDTIEDLNGDEQQEFVVDLANRVLAAPESAPTVCHLDTGVLRTHVLLRDSLTEADHHTIIGSSGNDASPQGHGTSMAGLALYGDHLDEFLATNRPVELRHRLESVRMMPGRHEPATDPINYGTATVAAVSVPEISAPARRRVFCLTLSDRSDTPNDPGQPTLWSAAVDALATGTGNTQEDEEFRLISEPDPEQARLFIVAAGNVADYQQDYRSNSETSAIEDPAQAWNALTVGAFTELVETPTDPQYTGWSPLATAGDVSPHSRTSLLFSQRKWPLKPDICMEGGNVLINGTDVNERHPRLSLRSTGNITDVSLGSANATSAAAAQAARLAALTMDRYPAYWPETVRGLLTHSAEWTSSMRKEINAEKTKAKVQRLIRTFGWGVPSEETVLNSSRQAVTLVSQDQLIPFEGKDSRLRSFQLHNLPWPREALEKLGAADVRLRVTLSYFIEPSASRRGWKRRYAYASHGLRFDLQDSTETQAEFIKRLNHEAQRDEDGNRPTSEASKRWIVGSDHRSLGSLHQDDWYGTGADLARCNNIAVYPVGGWWKYNPSAERRDEPVRYSLILSLRTKEEGVDLYTPIATQLNVPIPTTITSQ